jgi:capsular exopolysaccharide synthesis family protein
MAIAVQFLERKERSRIILFTSAQPAEGKTFCSYHCAVQLALLGQSVLLIDADLRKPSQHEMLEGSVLSPGLREYLSEQATVNEIIASTKIENLHFIAAGKTAPNPLRLLTGPSMGNLLAGLREQYQFIILDSAPVNPVSDTLLLAPHVDQVCLIARGGSTTLRSLRHTLSQLVSTGKKEASGIILNRFQRRRGLYYYGNYSYHKSYGEHGSYGDPQNEAVKKA